MTACATAGCAEPSLTPALGLCRECAERPVKIKARDLCGACYMRWVRAGKPGGELPASATEPWERLQDAAFRLARAVELGWSARSIESAEEHLKRAAEGYRRFTKRRRTAC